MSKGDALVLVGTSCLTLRGLTVACLVIRVTLE